MRLEYPKAVTSNFENSFVGFNRSQAIRISLKDGWEGHYDQKRNILRCRFMPGWLSPHTHVKAQNQVLGEVDFDTKTKVDKTSGVWWMARSGLCRELKDKKVLLLPETQNSVRHRYSNFEEQGLVSQGRRSQYSLACKRINAQNYLRSLRRSN